MEMDAQELAGTEQQPEPTRKGNRGSFRPGDLRINRKGRPKGIEALARRVKAGRPLCGHLKNLFVPSVHLRLRLLRPNGPWVSNLPPGIRLVACEMDFARDGVVFTLHSNHFPEVREGQPIPEIEPDYNGLKWVRPARLACEGII
jgi:hypothetical protein